jgi:hypothetical protein
MLLTKAWKCKWKQFCLFVLIFYCSHVKQWTMFFLVRMLRGKNEDEGSAKRNSHSIKFCFYRGAQSHVDWESNDILPSYIATNTSTSGIAATGCHSTIKVQFNPYPRTKLKSWHVLIIPFAYWAFNLRKRKKMENKIFIPFPLAYKLYSIIEVLLQLTELRRAMALKAFSIFYSLWSF